jgi:triphosphatase
MEIELKLLIHRVDAEKLIQHPLIKKYAAESPEKQDQFSIYFDSSDFILRRHDIGLRVRQIGDQFIQTMKAGGSVQGGLHQRNEWENPVPDAQPDISSLKRQIEDDSKLKALLDTVSSTNCLQPIFSVRVKRTIWNLQIDDNAIELVLDEGEIEREQKQLPISEIELELKSGEAIQLYEFALKLLDDIPLRLSNSSKALRGYMLATETDAAVSKAKSIALSHDETVEQAFQSIISNCLEHIQSNEEGVIEKHDDVECLHQMRVGTRRLRSALRLFQDMIPCPPELTKELQWLGGELGNARDWDVLTTSTLARLPAADNQESTKQLRSIASGVAKQMREKVSRDLLTTRYSKLIVSFYIWMHGKHWREQMGIQKANKLDKPIARIASKLSKHGHRCLIKRVSQVDFSDTHSLHRVRIAAKRNRYTVEFFQSLYPRKAIRRYIATLSAAQDELGWRNDFTIADRLLQQLHNGSQSAETAAFSRGYLAGRLQAESKKLRKTVKKFRRLTLSAIA